MNDRPDGFSHLGGYERDDEGKLVKKDRYKTYSERRLVVEICIALEAWGIGWNVEHETSISRVKHSVADIYIESENLALECKKRHWASHISEGVDQCEAYKSSGYNAAVVVPPKLEGAYDGRKATKKGVDILQFVVEDRLFEMAEDNTGSDYSFLPGL